MLYTPNVSYILPRPLSSWVPKGVGMMPQEESGMEFPEQTMVRKMTVTAGFLESSLSATGRIGISRMTR